MRRSSVIGAICFILSLGASSLAAASLTRASSVAFQTPGLISLTAVPLQPFSQSLTQLLNDPTATGLQWNATNLPSWLSLDVTNGILSGTPPLSAVGTTPFQITVAQGMVGDANHPFQITVSVAPPYWTANPITLPDGSDAAAYSQPVSSYAVNPEATPMTFSMVSGPAWATVSPTGVLSGSPAISDDGAVSVSVQLQTTIAGQSYQLTTVFQFNVQHIKRPPVWSQSSLSIQATVGQPFTLALSLLVTDPEGGTPTFSATGLPGWLTLNGSTLSGTPGPNDGGPVTGITVTATASGGSTSVPAQGAVAIVAPSWTGNPITLPDANDASAYSQSVSGYAVNPEATPMTFSMVSGPAWATVSPTGVLSGSPAISDDGAVSVSVQLQTTIAGQSYQLTTVFQFNVQHIKRPPVWSQSSLSIQATVGQPFTLALSLLVTDPEGGTPTFSATGLPGWLTLNGSTLSGTPGPNDGGPVTGITVTATASGGSTSVPAQGAVAIVAPSWTGNPITLPDANDASAYSQSVSGYAVNPEATPMTFSMVSGPAWATVSPTGVLSGSPAISDDGAVSVSVQLQTTIAGQSYQATTVFQFNVQHIKRPPVWSQSSLSIQATVGQPFTLALSLLVTDPEGGTPTFSATGLPGWLTLNGSTLSGTPGPNDGGPVTGITVTATASGGSTSVPAQGAVAIVAPSWTGNPITLPDANDASAYSQSVSGYAVNPEATPMTFSMVSGPAWATVSPTGVLSGSPAISDDGAVSVSVQLQTTIAGQSYQATTVFQFNVQHIKRPPVWSQNPVTISATVGIAFSLNLTSLVTNPEGGTMTFTATGLPSWLTLSQGGMLSGTAALADAGTLSGITFTVTASGGSVTAAGQGTVTVINPVWNVTSLNLGTATVGTPYSFNLATYVSNPMGTGAITFSAIGLPAWLTLNPTTGLLSGIPGPGDLGPILVTSITATLQGEGSASIGAQGTVVAAPPYWTGNPITLPDANDASAYSQSVSGYAVNPEATPMTFSKVSGPAWATVSPTGVLSGSPAISDDGAVSVSVQLQTTIAGQSYQLTTVFQFNVQHIKRPPVWSQNPVTISAVAGQAFSLNLASLVTNPEGGTITFTATGLPSWLTLSSNGQLSGTATLADAGDFSGITFTATASGGSTPAAGQGSVRVVYPQWDTGVLNLGTATVGVPYSFDLKPHVLNPLGSGTITFSAIGLPAWLTLNPTTGILSGTPAAGDIGTVVIGSILATLQGQGSASVGAQGTVVAAPPYWTGNPITLPDANDASAYSQSVSGYAVNPEATPMTFSMVSGPAWVGVSAAGVLSGSPAISDDGAVSMSVQFQTMIAGQSYQATTVFQFNVQHIKRPPVWSQDPVTISAAVGQAFSLNLASLATDPEGGTITFSATGLPAWLSLSPSGLLSGTPSLANAGNFAGITFTATASGGSTDTAGKGSVTVVPPRWSADPIALADATDCKAYQVDLTSYVINPDGLPLTYEMVSGPSWLTVSSTGVLSGTPDKCAAQAASVVVRFTGSAGGQTYTADTTFELRVVPPLYPPEWASAEVDLGTQYMNRPFTFDLNTVVRDPQDGALTFSATGLPSWMTLSTSGILSGTPEAGNIGAYQGIVFTATGPGGGATATGSGQVLKPVVPPKWIASPIPLADALAGTAYSADLSAYVLNPDHVAVTYTLLSIPFPPAWLSVDSVFGRLAGTAGAQDAGAVSVTVLLSAKIDGRTYETPAVIQFSVRSNGRSRTDRIAVDEPVPGARVENLWVVSDDADSKDLVGRFGRAAHAYFDDLARARLHHTGGLLATSGERGGSLIHASDQPVLMDSGEADVAADFRERLSLLRDGGEGESYSPLWSLLRFYRALPEMAAIYHHGYFTPGVPMEGMVVGASGDDFACLAQESDERSWEAGDYASAFRETHRKQGKPYRFSAIGPCSESGYGALVTATGGLRYGEEADDESALEADDESALEADDESALEADLHDYARKVIFRAYVTAKRRVKLANKPLDSKRISVRVGGTTLTGNTGTGDALWRYDGTKNEIAIRWTALIDRIKPGDAIEVTYDVGK